MPVAKKVAKKPAAAKAPKVQEMNLTLSTDLESLLDQAQGLAAGSRRKRAALAYDALAAALEDVLKLAQKK